jgi:HEAT repeat protein
MAGQPSKYLVVQGGPTSRHLALYAVEDSGPRLVAEEARSDVGASLCAWRDEKSGNIRLLTHDSLWRWTRKGELICETVKPQHIPSACGAVFAGSAVVVLEPVQKRGVRLCLKTKQWKRLHLAHLDGCEALWLAYEQRDRQAAARMLTLLDRAATGTGAQEPVAIFDMLTIDLLPVATVTSAGICAAETAPAEPSHEGTERRLLAGPFYARVLWEIWIDYERALPLALGELLRTGGEEDADHLVGALKASGDARLVAKIMTAFRGREPQRAPHWTPEGVRRLCRRLTPEDYALVLNARSDPDPAVAWFGAALPLRPQGPWKTMDELNQSEAQAIRTLVRLANHESIAVAEVALDTLVLMMSSRAIDDIAALLESEDAVRRELAINALSEFGPLARDVVAAVELRAESDPCPSVRAAGVQALCRLGPPTRVLPMILRFAHDAVDDVRGNAIAYAVLCSDELTEEQVRSLGTVSWVVRTARDDGSEPQRVGGVDWGRVIEARFHEGIRPNDLRALDASERSDVVALSVRDLFEARTIWGAAAFASDSARTVLEFALRVASEWETFVDAATLDTLCSDQVSPLAVGKAALQVLRGSPADGRDLVLMALLLLEPWQARFAPASAPHGECDEPLHKRLRRLGGPHPVVCEIRDRAWEWTKDPGVPGLAALYALMLGGDARASVELRRRLLVEPLDDAGFVVWACLRGLGAADRPAFIEQLRKRGDLPIGVRSLCDAERSPGGSGSSPD